MVTKKGKSKKVESIDEETSDYSDTRIQKKMKEKKARLKQDETSDESSSSETESEDDRSRSKRSNKSKSKRSKSKRDSSSSPDSESDRRSRPKKNGIKKKSRRKSSSFSSDSESDSRKPKKGKTKKSTVKRSKKDENSSESESDDVRSRKTSKRDSGKKSTARQVDSESESDYSESDSKAKRSKKNQKKKNKCEYSDSVSENSSKKKGDNKGKEKPAAKKEAGKKDTKAKVNGVGRKQRKSESSDSDFVPDRSSLRTSARKPKLDSSRILCTACGVQLNYKDCTKVKRHPVLKVLMCKRCYKYYNSGEIACGDDGLDEQCRWCGDGGNLVGCDKCSNVFCKACIIRNLGRSGWSETQDDDKWKCYVCKPKKVKALYEMCQTIKAELKKERKKEEAKAGKNNSDNSDTEEQEAPIKVSLMLSNLFIDRDEIDSTVRKLLLASSSLTSLLESCNKDLSAINSHSSEGKAVRLECARCVQTGLQVFTKSARGAFQTLALRNAKLKKKALEKDQKVSIPVKQEKIFSSNVGGYEVVNISDDNDMDVDEVVQPMAKNSDKMGFKKDVDSMAACTQSSGSIKLSPRKKVKSQSSKSKQADSSDSDSDGKTHQKNRHSDKVISPKKKKKSREGKRKIVDSDVSSEDDPQCSVKGENSINQAEEESTGNDGNVGNDDNVQYINDDDNENAAAELELLQQLEEIEDMNNDDSAQCELSSKVTGDSATVSQDNVCKDYVDGDDDDAVDDHDAVGDIIPGVLKDSSGAMFLVNAFDENNQSSDESKVGDNSIKQSQDGPTTIASDDNKQQDDKNVQEDDVQSDQDSENYMKSQDDLFMDVSDGKDTLESDLKDDQSEEDNKENSANNDNLKKDSNAESKTQDSIKEDKSSEKGQVNISGVKCNKDPKTVKDQDSGSSSSSSSDDSDDSSDIESDDARRRRLKREKRQKERAKEKEAKKSEKNKSDSEDEKPGRKSKKKDKRDESSDSNSDVESKKKSERAKEKEANKADTGKSDGKDEKPGKKIKKKGKQDESSDSNSDGESKKKSASEDVKKKKNSANVSEESDTEKEIQKLSADVKMKKSSKMRESDSEGETIEMKSTTSVEKKKPVKGKRKDDDDVSMSSSENDDASESEEECDSNRETNHFVEDAASPPRKSKDSDSESDDESSDDSETSDSDTDSTHKKKKKIKQKKGKKVSESESDSSGDLKKKKKLKSKLLEAKISDSDSDFQSVKKRGRSARKKKASSDSDAGPKKRRRKRVNRSYSSDESDSELEKPKRKRRGRKKRKASSSSSPDSGKVSDEARPKLKKKKRRRINSSDESGGRSAQEQGSDENGDTPKGGRKYIKKILSTKKLADTTKAAEKAEQDRRERIIDRQKKFNMVQVTDEKDPLKCPITTKLVLESDDKNDDKVLLKVDSTLVKKLKPHQADAVKFMWDCCCETVKQMKTENGAGCILAHCMGLGKTLSVIAFLHTLMANIKRTKINTVLVVCPLNTVLNWQNEFDKWLDDVEPEIEVWELSGNKTNDIRAKMLKTWHDNGGIMIIGYEMYRNLSSGSRIKKKKIKEQFFESLVNPGPDIVICDEGHVLKNNQSNLAKAVNSMRTRRRVVLTGTPLQNNLTEYHCMVSFVKPDLLGTRKEFCNRFINPITNGQCKDSTQWDVKLMKKRAHVLHEKLNGCVQRKDYSALTKFLPPKFEYVISVRMSPTQIDLYEQFLQTKSMVAENMSVPRGHRLFADYQALMRIWTHPWVLKMEEERQEYKNMFKYETSEDEETDNSMDSFLDDSTSQSDVSSSDSDNSDSASEKKKKKSNNSDSASEKKKKKSKGRKTRGSRHSDSDKEVTDGWKSSSRNGEDPPKTEEDNALSSDWWAKYVTEADQFNMDLSGKLSLLFAVLRMSEEIGDKVLVFSQSLLSLDLVENYLEHIDQEAQLLNSVKKNKIISDDEGSNGEGEAKPKKEEDEEKIEEEFGKSWTRGADYFRMDGSTSAQHRQSAVDQFNDPENYRARLFLISTRAGSLGINLVSANRVIIFDASWNPSYDIQSIFRVYRFGQDKPCYVYRFLAQGTMEEKIYERQVTKQSLSQRVVDEHQIERHFSQSDMKELYNFTPERLDDPDREKKQTPMLPKDTLLAELLKSQGDWIVTYHEHDSLLENKVDEGLTEDERKTAWDEYENDKNQITQQFNTGMNMGVQGAMGQQNMYAGMMPNNRVVYPNIGHMGVPANPMAANNILKIVQEVRNRFPNITQEQFQLTVQGLLRQQMSQQMRIQEEMRRREIERQQFEEYQRMKADPNYRPAPVIMRPQVPGAVPLQRTVSMQQNAQKLMGMPSISDVNRTTHVRMNHPSASNVQNSGGKQQVMVYPKLNCMDPAKQSRLANLLKSKTTEAPTSVGVMDLTGDSPVKKIVVAPNGKDNNSTVAEGAAKSADAMGTKTADPGAKSSSQKTENSSNEKSIDLTSEESSGTRRSTRTTRNSNRN